LYEWEPDHGGSIVDEPTVPTPERRVAVVTGANHGIGAATAVALAAAGVDVLATYLRLDDEPDPGLPARYAADRARGADAVLAAMAAHPGRGVALEIDITAPGATSTVFDEAERQLGPVSILLNNASGWQADTFAPRPIDGRRGPSESSSERTGQQREPSESSSERTGQRRRALALVSAATIERNLAVDARGGAVLIAELARRHIARGATWGRIVGLTSGGPNGFPQEVSYGAAKAALDNYTMSAAAELAPYGITANVVHPPVTDTGWVTDEVRAFVAGSVEHHHVADPADVAAVIAWLCSDAAWLVTGNVVRLR
jgi:3-oxoacyl-[acyl-carrier protein] reductase